MFRTISSLPVFVLFLSLGLGLHAPTAFGLPQDQCAITYGATSGKACPNPLFSTTTPFPDAARSDPNGPKNGQALGPIDVWSKCRFVDNISTSSSIFVPFRSLNEWNAFANNAPKAIASLTHCSRVMGDSIPPNYEDSNNCFNANPASQPVSLAYARYPDPATNQPPQQTIQVSFQCTDASGKNPWTETATAVYQGRDSDTYYDTSWVRTSLTYSSSGTNAKCGADNGGNFNTLAPDDSNLCASGIVQNFTAPQLGTWVFEEQEPFPCQPGSAAPYPKDYCNGPCAGNGSSCLYNPNRCSERTYECQGAGSSATWSWTCASADGGTNASCSAYWQPPPNDCIPGICGPANGKAFPNAGAVNAAGLCGSGFAQPGAAMGNGPWIWMCHSSECGDDSGCVAMVGP